jgi:hypothetical protein
MPSRFDLERPLFACWQLGGRRDKHRRYHNAKTARASLTPAWPARPWPRRHSSVAVDCGRLPHCALRLSFLARVEKTLRSVSFKSDGTTPSVLCNTTFRTKLLV